MPALWDIADAFGRSALVTGWWAAWPPTAPNSVFYDTPVEESANAVYPAALADRAASLAVPPDTVGYAQVRRFLNLTPDEWDNATKNPSDPAMIFRSILAKTWTDHRVAINLYNDQRQHGQDPMLVMVSYEGTDAVNHLFAPYHPPYRDGISEASYRKYWPAVANYYAEVDRLIGEWMGVLPRDTTVMIMSSYGFRWGKNRPRSMPNGGAALSDHRNPGMFIAYGPHVVANHAAQPMSVYDVAPTVLSLLGLPQAADMPGHVTTWAFKDVAPITSVRVVSYAEFVNSKPLITAPHIPEAPYARELQAIGHLNDPTHNLTPVLEDEDQDARQRAAAPLSPERWGQYAYYNNLGIELRGKGKMSEAVDAFDRAIDINPTRPTPHLNEAMTHVRPAAVHACGRTVPESRGPRPAECGELLHRLCRALPPAQHGLARHRAAVPGEATLPAVVSHRREPRFRASGRAAVQRRRPRARARPRPATVVNAGPQQPRPLLRQTERLRPRPRLLEPFAVDRASSAADPRSGDVGEIAAVVRAAWPPLDVSGEAGPKKP